MAVSKSRRAFTVFLAVFCVVQFNLQAASAYNPPNYRMDFVPARSDDDTAMTSRLFGLGGMLGGRGTAGGAGKVGSKVGAMVKGSIEAEGGGQGHFGFGFGSDEGFKYGVGLDTYGSLKAKGKATGILGGGAQGQVGAKGKKVASGKGELSYGLSNRSFKDDVQESDNEDSEDQSHLDNIKAVHEDKFENRPVNIYWVRGDLNIHKQFNRPGYYSGDGTEENPYRLQFNYPDTDNNDDQEVASRSMYDRVNYSHLPYTPNSRSYGFPQVQEYDKFQNQPVVYNKGRVLY